MRPVFLLGLLLALGLGANPARARLLESWPYQRLFKEADLVVLARAVSTADSGEKSSDNLWKAEFQGVNTTFQVAHVLKGKLEGKRLKVLHYRLKDGQLIENGPLLVTFRLKELFIRGKDFKASVPPPDYLLFLRKRGDGRYEPVSGKTDPQLSVREVYGGLPFPEEGGRRK